MSDEATERLIAEIQGLRAEVQAISLSLANETAAAQLAAQPLVAIPPALAKIMRRGYSPDEVCAELKADIERWRELGILNIKALQTSKAGSASIARLHFSYYPHGLGGTKGISAASIEYVPMLHTPLGERGWVDVGFDDKFPLGDQSLAALFGIVFPLFESGMQPGAVDEHGNHLVVIRFAIPNHSNRFDG